MKTLELTGWKVGVQTVSLIEAVRTYSTGSLGTAKELVERLLAGETVSLAFDSDEKRRAFQAKAEELGAVVR
jgi:hypothetical protein